MNEIKLPPLPAPDTQFGHSDTTMVYYAVAAVEADRHALGMTRDADGWNQGGPKELEYMAEMVSKTMHDYALGGEVDEALSCASAALRFAVAAAKANIESARGAQSAAPEGWKLVPIEPTLEMVEAGTKIRHGSINTAIIWMHMILAAPTPPKEEA